MHCYLIMYIIVLNFISVSSDRKETGGKIKSISHLHTSLISLSLYLFFGSSGRIHVSWEHSELFVMLKSSLDYFFEGSVCG